MPFRQSESFPATANVFWIVEEYDRSPESPLNYAWCFTSQSDAEACLINNVRRNGHSHLYCMFLFVQE